jgi:acyl dehydratase
MATETQVITSVDELKQHIGEELRVGDWHLVTQEEVNAFADATGDHQWIHVDPERAKTSPYGGTIAHGYYTLSTWMQWLRGGESKLEVRMPSRMGVNYGLNKVRFPNAVPVGKRVRARSKLVAVEEVQPGVVQQTQEITVEVEGESKPAMVAEVLTRSYK